MAHYIILFVTILLVIFQETLSTHESDSYSAVVVEYTSDCDPMIDSETNILNNVKNFIDLTNIAKDKYKMDIIVFPEAGLKGYGNQEQYVQVPDPMEHVRPCASNTTYEAPLVQLSCAARAANTYIVVNLGEKFYNSTQQKNIYFNTDVVFDPNGTIIARYRKIHLFSEKGRSPSPNRELVYFDTAFGVRFGIFTCFDIIFEDPGIILANNFNITHFIFPTAWFSQLPFLTAIQEQHYWSYTQDVVLLASGYNDPAVGSSGTGIYLGRQGPAIYNMTETSGTFMLHSNVPKKLTQDCLAEENVLKTETPIIIDKAEHLMKPLSDEVFRDKITLKQEGFINRYNSKLIVPPTSSMEGFNGSTFTVPFRVEEYICQNDLCCNFYIYITAVFNKTTEGITRGDDYSQLFYRLVVFDGVRDYDKIAYGGLQTCAVISCIDSKLSSCGLRSDDTSARPNMMYGFFQTAFMFNSIKISGNFSNKRSFVGPNVLLTGEGSNFGSLLPSESFTFIESQTHVNGTIKRLFETITPISKLVTASVYGRLFSRDYESQSSSASGPNNCLVIIISIFVIAISSYIGICRCNLFYSNI